jgi:hypothetical protein
LPLPATRIRNREEDAALSEPWGPIRNRRGRQLRPGRTDET